MRMMGMASGMDTDFIIQQSMRAHQMRIDNQMRARTTLQWRMDTHNEVRSQVNTFRSTFLTTQGSQGLLNRNSFNANRATAMGLNSDAVTLRALGGSQSNTITIGQVRQLASGAGVRTSDTARTAFQGVQTSARLDSLSNINFGFSTDPADRNINLNVGGTNVSLSQAEFDALNSEANWDNANEVSRFSLTGNTVAASHRNIALTKTDTDGVYNFTAGTGENRVTGRIELTLVTEAVLDEDGNQTYDEDGNEITREVTNAVITFTDSDGNPIAEDDLTSLQTNLKSALSSQLSLNSNGNVQRGSTALVFNQEMVVSAQTDSEDNVIRPEFTLTRSSSTNTDGDTVHTIRHGNTTIDEQSFFSTQTININGTNVELRSNMTINQMLNAVNSQVSDVRMTFETLTGRFNLESLSTGESSGLDLTASPSTTFFSALGFEPQNGSLVFEGQNAQVYVNGDLITSESNTFNFGGVAITLNRTTNGQGTDENGNTVGEASNNITINISRDTDGVVDRIRAFVDSYNQIIQKIENLTRERRAPHEVSYGPLTDEEKATMTDRQIEQWEEIARRGIMRNDSALTNLASNLRRELFISVEQAGLSPSQIGLTTGSFHSGTGGQIVLDEDRLRAVLEEDPERVANVFAGTEGNRGLLWRMNDIMGNYSSPSGAGSRAIRNLEDSIRRNNEQVTRMQNRMFAEEDRLFRQFAAMETAMSRMQSQGDWFTAMLGGR